MQRKASAVWQGDLKSGKGTLSTDSGVLKQSAYSFHSRFESGIGTNPEELLAAAHAGCFTMALSAQLGGAGLVAQKLETTATISLEKVGDGFSITSPLSPAPTKPNSTQPSKPPKPAAPSPNFSKPKSRSTPNSSDSIRHN